MLEALTADPEATRKQVRAKIEAEHADEKQGSRGRRVCIVLAPNATKAAASTTSCAAGPAGRVTLAIQFFLRLRTI